MIRHSDIRDSELFKLIWQKQIVLGGNLKLKIYGRLKCSSGKRMKKQNRVFFVSEEDAIRNGFRPCGHCMNADYKKWKNEII